MLIRIVPLGNLSEKVLQEIDAALREVFNARCKILPGLLIPQESFNYWRKQYNAEKILNFVSKQAEAKFIDKAIPTLLVTDQDIYLEDLNFVFGVEDPEKSCCMVSIARLRPEFYDQRPNPTVLNERAVKEAIHEIGHHLGLPHCKHSFCVMNFSPSVINVDRKQKYFCRGCKIRASMRGVNIE